MALVYTKIVSILHKANNHLQWPKIRLKSGYTLSLAGSRAQFPHAVNITDGGSFGDNKWYGRIRTDGVLKMPNSMQKHAEALIVELDLFMLDPAKYAKGMSDITEQCMYCRKKLTNPQSVAVGYGETCAAHYGLPYGNIDPEEAKKQASLEFDLSSGNKATEIEFSVANADELRPQDNCDCGLYPPNMACVGNEKCKREQSAIEHLHKVRQVMLSNAKQTELLQLIAFNPNDEYMLLVTALWEAL